MGVLDEAADLLVDDARDLLGVVALVAVVAAEEDLVLVVAHEDRAEDRPATDAVDASDDADGTAARTLLAIEDMGVYNVGIVLDLGHSFFAKETPADVLQMVARRDKLVSVEVNDNWREWDDDMSIGSVNLIETLEKEEIARVTAGKTIPSFDPGDTVRVNVKIKEGDKERIQVFEGVVIRRRGGGINENFTVRKISFGEGVERVFPLYSPSVAEIAVLGSTEMAAEVLPVVRDLVADGVPVSIDTTRAAWPSSSACDSSSIACRPRAFTPFLSKSR